MVIRQRPTGVSCWLLYHLLMLKMRVILQHLFKSPKTFFAAIAVLQRTKHECSSFLNANLVHFITLQALGICVSSYSQIPSQKCH